MMLDDRGAKAARAQITTRAQPREPASDEEDMSF
jgi:hypothetical protein